MFRPDFTLAEEQCEGRQQPMLRHGRRVAAHLVPGDAAQTGIAFRLLFDVFDFFRLFRRSLSTSTGPPLAEGLLPIQTCK